MLQKLYELLTHRKPSIEDTNAAGGRFIREAKIYDLKLKNYRESLDDVHPSLDASTKRARRTPGSDIVAQELDQMNKEYSSLVDTVLQHLNQLQDDEAKLQERRVRDYNVMFDVLPTCVFRYLLRNYWYLACERYFIMIYIYFSTILACDFYLF